MYDPATMISIIISLSEYYEIVSNEIVHANHCIMICLIEADCWGFNVCNFLIDSTGSSISLALFIA